MKNTTTRQKLRAVFKAALWGVALSLGFSLSLRSYFFQGGMDLLLGLILLIPTIILSNIFGLEAKPEWRGLTHSFAFTVVANVLFITFFSVVFALFWQFVVKGRSKNQTTKNK
jgi:hypothetical protein